MSFTDYMWVIFISMLPVIELRGAIPVAIALGFHPVAAFAVCVLANLVPVPFILLFVKTVFKYMKKWNILPGLVDWLERKAQKKSGSVSKYRFWGLAAFVAVPLPGTGAWTGSLIAALMGMKLKEAFPAVLIGVIVAGIVVTVISTGAFAGLDFLKQVFFLK